MQMQLAFEASPLLPRIRDRLIEALGPQRPDARLGPISQLIKSMISSRTHEEAAWAAFVRLRKAYPDWAYLAEAPSLEVERVIEGATHAEKSTSKAGALNAVSATGGMNAAAAAPAAAAADDVAGPACMLRPGDPGFEECEACQ